MDKERNLEFESSEVPTTIADEVRQSARIGRLLGDLVRGKDELLVALQVPGLSPRVQRVAYEELCRVMSEVVIEPAAGGGPRLPSTSTLRPRWQGVPGVFQRLWRAADTACERVLLGVRRPRPQGSTSRAWTVTGLALAATTAAFIILGLFPLALVTLLTRLVGSTVAAGPDVGQQGSSGFVVRECRTIRSSLLACLAAHLSDIVLGMALATAVAMEGAPAWALLGMSAVVISLFGTVSRVAAERNGFRISRSALERVFHNGGLLAGLGATVLATSTDIPIGVAPALLAAACGLALYGTIELARVAAVLAVDPDVPRWAITVSQRRGGDLSIDGFRQAADAEPEKAVVAVR